MSYLVSFAGELWRLRRGPSRLTHPVILGMATAGFLAHTIFLIVRSRAIGLPPLLSSQQDWLLVLAWLGALLYLAGLLARPRVATGVFLLPAVMLLIAAGFFVSDAGTGNLTTLSLRRWGMFHAASLVLGIAAVFGAALSGLMYLLSVQRLKRRSSWMNRLTLPSLEQLTSANRWMVVTSVPLLTIGLLTGFLLIAWNGSDAASSTIIWSDPTIVTTVAVWIGMLAVFVRALLPTPQPGRQVAMLSLLAGGFLLVAVLGPMLLAGTGRMETFHSRPRTTQSDGPDPAMQEAQP